MLSAVRLVAPCWLQAGEMCWAGLLPAIHLNSICYTSHPPQEDLSWLSTHKVHDANYDGRLQDMMRVSARMGLALEKTLTEGAGRASSTDVLHATPDPSIVLYPLRVKLAPRGSCWWETSNRDEEGSNS